MRKQWILLGFLAVLGATATVRADSSSPNMTLTVVEGAKKKPAVNVPVVVEGINGDAVGTTDDQGVFRFGFDALNGARLIVCISTSAPGKALEITDGLEAPDGDNCRYICPSNNVLSCSIDDDLHARLVKAKAD